MSAFDIERRSWLLHKLTAPTDSLTEPEARRQAQFLAALLLTLVPLGLVAAVLPSLVSHSKAVLDDPSFYVALGAAAVAAFAYRLSRTKAYRRAADLTVIIASLAMFAASFTDSNPVQLEAAVYLVIPVLLASILLSIRATALVAALHALGLLALPLVVPGANWVDSVLNPLCFNIIASLLILLVAGHRNLLESDRRAGLEQRIQERTAELTEERNLLRTLIDHLPDPVFVKDAQGKIIINNIADARYFGLTPAECIGKTDFDLFPPELAEQYHADDQAILQSGQPRVDYEEPSVDQEGSQRWMLTTKVPLRDRLGNIVGLVGINRDITERKRAEDALRQGQEELERRVNERTAHLREQIAERERVERELQRERDFALQVMNALGQGLTVSDEERRFVFVNPAFARMLGYTPEALIGKTPMDLAFPEELELLDRVRAERQAGKATTYEMRLRHADGSPVPALITGVPRWQDGKVIGAIGAVTDLTERKQAEEALRLSEERFSKAFHANPSAIVISSLEEGRVVDANEAYLNLLGYCRDEVIGRTALELNTWAEPEGRSRVVRLLREQGSVSRLEICIRTKSGQIRYTLASLEIIELAGKPHILGMIDDYTERKQMEEALRQSEARYRTVSEMISDYAYSYEVWPDGSIHHDWTTESFTRLTGFTPEDLGNTFRLYHPDDEALAQQHTQQTIAGQPTSGQYRIVTKSGEVRWLHIARQPVWDEAQQRVVRFFGVAQDITERKQAEEALKATNQMLRSLIEGSPLAIISLDANTHVQLWNPAAERLFGWKAEEVVGRPYPLVSGDGRSEFNVLFTHVLRGGLLNNLEVRRLKRDGSLLDVSLSAAPMLDASGNIVGTITMLADLTERKRAEEALQASEEAARQFQEQLTALHEVTIELSKADSVDDVCRLAVELGRSRLGFDRLGIWFVDESGKWMLGSFGTDEAGRIRDERAKRIPVLEDLITGEMLKGHHFYFRETNMLYDENHQTVGQGWIAAAALWDGGRVIGSVSADNLIQRQPVSKYQLELLNLYGSTIGHLCTRKRTEAAERDQRRLAEALRDAAAAINSSLELDTVLDRLLVQVERVIPYDASTIMLIEHGCAYVAHSRGYAERGLGEAIASVCLPVHELPNLRVMAETGQPFIISHVEQYPYWANAPETEWIRSHVGAPIQIEGKVIGFLSISSATPDQFTPAHAERLKAFADQAAIAIHNARLYDAVRRHANELEQHVAERTAELESERAQLQTILDGMGEGVTGIIFDEHQRIKRRYINSAMYDLLGYTAEELDPMLVQSASLSHEEKLPLMSAVNQAVTQRGNWRGETRMRRKDGTEFDAYFNINRVNDPDGNLLGMVTIMRDISQEKALQDQRSRFVAHASHELRTPITNLKTRLYLIRKQPEKLNDHLAVVEEVTERMKKLVEDLLDLSRLERGVIPLKRETLALQSVITDVIRVQQAEAERKDIALTCDLAPESLLVYADRERITQVVTNLVANAINYTPAGGSVRVAAARNGSKAVIEVEDTGIGIAPDHLPHLFQPFYRVGETAGGTGLGLSIAREIVAMHDGAISVESAVGRGSRFTLTFALQAAPN